MLCPFIERTCARAFTFMVGVHHKEGAQCNPRVHKKLDQLGTWVGKTILSGKSFVSKEHREIVCPQRNQRNRGPRWGYPIIPFLGILSASGTTLSHLRGHAILAGKGAACQGSKKKGIRKIVWQQRIQKYLKNRLTIKKWENSILLCFDSCPWT